MIIARSPLRISLGGGTDLPSYFREHTGFLVAAAINRHVHIVINRTILPELILKYSQTERVTNIEEIHHPLFREAMRLVGIPAEGLEIAGDGRAFPLGRASGSSGSLQPLLLRCASRLHRNGNPWGRRSGGSGSATSRSTFLNEPVGKQLGISSSPPWAA